jgi:thiazole synthase ThiGH ThiG subunit
MRAFYCTVCAASIEGALDARIMARAAGFTPVYVCSEACERTYHAMVTEELRRRARQDPLGEAFSALLRDMGVTFIDTSGDTQ